jgi:hypothetical protein
LKKKYNKCKMYNVCEQSLKGSQGKNCTRPRGTVQIKSTQIRWFSGQSDRRLDLMRGGQIYSKLSYLKMGGQSGSSTLRSDGSCEGQAGG